MELWHVVQIVLSALFMGLGAIVGWVFKEVVSLKADVRGLRERQMVESEAMKQRLDSLSDWMKALNTKMDALSIQIRNGQDKARRSN